VLCAHFIKTLSQSDTYLCCIISCLAKATFYFTNAKYCIFLFVCCFYNNSIYFALRQCMRRCQEQPLLQCQPYNIRWVVGQWKRLYGLSSPLLLLKLSRTYEREQNKILPFAQMANLVTVRIMITAASGLKKSTLFLIKHVTWTNTPVATRDPFKGAAPNAAAIFTAFFQKMLHF